MFYLSPGLLKFFSNEEIRMSKFFLDLRDFDSLIKGALAEDIQSGDITCKALNIQKSVEGSIYSKQEGILCGIEIVKAVFHALDPHLNIHLLKKDGEKFRTGEKILWIEGQASSILTAERTALNFLGHLSGIATLTHAFVQEISHTQCKILDTRKTTPLFRSLEKYAVTCGGGMNHRAGLWDMILIKENHLRAVGNIDIALKRAITWKKENKSQVKIEIEVTNLEEFFIASAFPIDIIMLDHFSIEDMKQAVKKCPNSIKLEASGNITYKTVRIIAETGVHFISSGALTHSVPSVDFSLLFDE